MPWARNAARREASAGEPASDTLVCVRAASSSFWSKDHAPVLAIAAFAVAALGALELALPAALEVHMQTADMAEVASWVRGAERTGTRTVTIGGDDPMAMFRSFVAVTYITRQSEGR